MQTSRKANCHLGVILDQLVEEISGNVEERLRHVAGEGLVRIALDGVVGIVDGGLALVLPEPGQHTADREGGGEVLHPLRSEIVLNGSAADPDVLLLRK